MIEYDSQIFLIFCIKMEISLQHTFSRLGEKPLETFIAHLNKKDYKDLMGGIINHICRSNRQQRYLNYLSSCLEHQRKELRKVDMYLEYYRDSDLDYRENREDIERLRKER